MEFRWFLLIVCSTWSFAWGQSSTTDAVSSSGFKLPPRKLADGVMTVVPPDEDFSDTISGVFDLEFVSKNPDLAWVAPDFPDSKPFFSSPAETLLEKSKKITFRHEVWSLEFSFKPVRLIEVDLPLPSGETERKVCWYMVYSVRYPGKDMAPVVDQESDIPSRPGRIRFESVRFLPRFQLVSKERNFSQDPQILPVAKAAIEAKERVGRPLLDHVEISKYDIPVSDDKNQALWGVVIWTNVDPRVDFFAVDVRGLSNAFKVRVDSEGKTQFDRKTLRIYHWRAGDAIDEGKDRIRLGIPAFEDPERVSYYLKQYNLPERLDYQWIYR